MTRFFVSSALTRSFPEVILSVTLVTIFILPGINTQANPAPPPAAIDPAVQQALNALSSQIASLTNSVTANTQSISTLQSSTTTLGQGLSLIQAEVTVLSSEVEDLTGQTQKLEKVNKIWSANFGIVKSIFAQLKKKVTFKLSPPQLLF